MLIFYDKYVILNAGNKKGALIKRQTYIFINENGGLPYGFYITFSINFYLLIFLTLILLRQYNRENGAFVFLRFNLHCPSVPVNNMLYDRQA